MHGLNLKDLSIEALAALRDDAVKLLGEKVATRSKELEGEIDRLQGLTSAEITPRGTKAKPKYRLNGQQWSGRGSQPAWVKPTSTAAEAWRI